MKLFRAITFVCSAQLCFFIDAHAVSWPLYPWISSSHEINQGYNCQEYIGGVLYRHGGERCGSQMYKTGFVMSQIGLFDARGGAHDGIDIITDNRTSVGSVDWLDVDKYNIVAGGSDIVVSANSNCAEGDSNAAGIRYRNVRDWFGSYQYNYWHLGCINYIIHDWWLNAETWKVYELYPGQYMGTVGETGNADVPITPNGPHLHFGVKQNENWIEPLTVLDDWSPPDLKFNYIVSNFGADNSKVLSIQNSEIVFLPYPKTIYAKTFAKFGIETSDNVIVKKVRFDLLRNFDYTFIVVKNFTLNPDSRATTDNPNQFWYFPEWKGIFLRSRAPGGSQAPPSPDPENVSNPWNYDINPDALISFTVGSEQGTVNLAQGQYTLRVTAEDFKGNTRSDEIALVLDRIPPAGTISLRDSDGLAQFGYTNSEIIKVFLLNLSDDVSSVDAVRLSNDGLFDTPFESFQAINPFLPVVLWTLLSGDGQKPVYAQFRDRAGNISERVSAQIRLDTGLPSLDAPGAAGGGFLPQGEGDTEAGPAPGLHYISASQFNFTWDPGFFSDPNGISGYSIVIKNLTNHTMHQQGAAIMPSFTATDLQQGNTYYAQVQAKDPAGNLSPQIGTGRVIIDATPPLISAINDGNFTNQTSQLAATWQASDPESGIQEILYSIGTAPGGADIKGFTSVGTQLSTTVLMGAALAEGVYYWTIKAFNQAGLTAQLTGDGIIVDITPPPAPVLSPTSWQNTKEYSLSWITPVDVSGIAGARVKFDGEKPNFNNEGGFLPGQSSVVYSANEIVNGQKGIWVWLEDNAGNANPATAVSLTLRYDDILPVSAANAPSLSTKSVVSVSFISTDEGALTELPTGSGVSKTVLWSGYPSLWCRWISPGQYRERYYCAYDGPVAWSSSTYVQTGPSGIFSFPTDKEGDWYFYTQAYDAAGNAEPIPVSTSAKGHTYVDATAPVISGIKAAAFSPDSAVIEWTTDDETTAVIAYGRTTALGTQYTVTAGSKTHSVTLTGLPNPADIYFKITATNKTGLAAAKDGTPFKTPLNISYTTDIFGLIDYDKPVILSITNPDIASATLVIDGQTWSGTVNTSEPVTIYVDTAVTGGGTHAINITADGYEYSSNFVVDTAVRTVKLARLVVSKGGVMTSTAVIPGDFVADMTAGQEMQGEMSNGTSRLYLGYYAGIDPVAPAAIGNLAATPGPEPGQMSLAWTAPGDDANVGTAMKYEIRYSTVPLTAGNFASAALAAGIPLPQQAGTAQTHVISGLENGKIYYFAIMAMDELPNQSLSNIVSVKTLEVAQSAAQIGGKPAVKVVSKIPDLNIAQVPAGSQEATALAARGAAPGQGLLFFSDIYEITHSMQLTEGATVQFSYADPGTDVERELAVYKYNPAISQWVLLASAVDADNNIITAITYSFSLFAVFARDTKPPATDIVFEGGSTYRDNLDDIYISSRTLLGFRTEDPALGGRPGSGVKETGYKIDSSTTPFITFTGAFPPGEGFHGVQYRSIDNAGNAEQTKQSSIRVDASAPVISFMVDKATITLRDKMIVPAASCALTVTVFDPSVKGAASGVRYASVAVNGENITAGEAGFVKQLPGGAYHVAASAEDNLGNRAESQIDILVVPDTLLPRSGLGTVGTVYRAGGTDYITAKASFTLTSVDDLIASGDGAGGVKKQNVKIYTAGNLLREESFLNPKPEQGGIFTSTFSPAAWSLPDGAYHLDYNAEDLLGNAETVRRSTIALDNLPPETAAQFSGAAGPTGWYVSPVETAIVSADALSGVKEIHYSLDAATYTLYASRFTISPEGGHSLKYYAADFLGNTEAEKSAVVKLDLSSPTIQVSVVPAPNAYGWNNGPVGVMFTGSDTVSGLAFCSSSATVSGEGAGQLLSGACFDNAGLSSTRAVSVSIDSTPPSVLYAQTPAASEDGWNRGDITLKFTCADNLAGVKSCPADIVLGGEGVNISTSAGAVDYADNSRAVSVTGIKIDRTLPVSTAVVSGTWRNGWYSAPVNIALTSADSLSGIEKTGYRVEGPGYDNEEKVYTGPLNFSADGSYTIRYYPRDKAGNNGTENSILFSIDRTAPQVNYTLNPPPNLYGWNNSGVEAVFSGADTLSGMDICTSSRTYIEGPGKTLAGWCRDKAGNIRYSTAVVNIDVSSPIVTVNAIPAPNSAGWNNTTVSVTFSGYDAISSNSYCTADKTVSSEGAVQGVSGTCTDFAGNSRSAFHAVNIDRTAPVTTMELSGTPVNGWYNTAVSITLASADSLSNVKQTNYRLECGGVLVSSGVYASPVVAGADGLYTMHYYGIDKAGNAEAEKPTAFKIDRTQPQVSYARAPMPNTGGWNNTAVQVGFNGTDSLSGVVECSSWTISTEGPAQTVAGWCRDAAGNTGYSTATLNIDLTRPAASATQIPAPNSRGWNNSPVTVKFSGTDGLSGVSYCSPDKLTSVEGSGQNVSGYCLDYAGNSGTAALTLNIDRTSPAITISSPAAGTVFIATRGDIKINFAATDNLDPAPVFTAFLVQTEDRGSPRGGRPAGVAVTNGQAIEPLDIDDGMWRLTVSATDFADNAAYLAGGMFEVIHDMLPPRTAQSVSGGPLFTAGGTTYIRKDTELKLTSIDDLVASGDAVGLGVARQTLTIKTGGVALRTLTFTNQKPEQGVAFVSTFSLDREADGLYYTHYGADDVLGNTETVRISGVALDNTAPAAAYHTGSPYYAAGGLNYITPATPVSFTAEDPVINGVAAGVARMETAVDGGQRQIYAQPLKLGEGRHTIKYRAVDNVGNTEAEKTLEVQSDNTAPVTTRHIGSPYYVAGGINYIAPATPITFTADDPITTEVASGVGRIEVSVNGGAYIKYSSALTFVEGRHTVKYRAIDNVGNTEAEKTLDIQSDNTPPNSDFVSSGQYYESAGHKYAPLTFTYSLAAEDPVVGNVASGVKFNEYRIDRAAFNTYNTAFSLAEGIRFIEYRSQDNVSNTELLKAAAVYVDGTVPQSLVSIGQPRYETSGGIYVSSWTLFSLSSVDPEIKSVASGVKNINYRFGAETFKLYPAAFAAPMPDGGKVLEYYGTDNAGNAETAGSRTVKLDATTPLTTLIITHGKQSAGPSDDSFYSSLDGRFALQAADPVTGGVAGGVRQTSWSDNNGTPAYSTDGLAFTEGRHLLSYRSIDNIDNLEVIRSTTILVDNTAPVTTHHIGSPYYAAGGVNYITPATPLTFTAADPMIAEVASGVERMEVSVDGGAYIKCLSALNFAEGRHTVKYRAIDNVGNTEAEKTLEVQSDNTTPVSKWLAASGSWVEKAGRFYLNASGRVALESVDPVVNGVTSGLEGIYYGIDTAPALKYAAAFGLDEGIRTVNYRARDNVGNTEVIRSTVIYADGTAPVSALSLSGDQYKGDRQYISRRTDIIITAEDPVVNEVAAGVKTTGYRVEGIGYGNEENVYASPFKLNSEGKHLVSFYSADQVNNVEAVKTAGLWVDATPPATALTISGVRYSPPGDDTIYITKDSGVVLTSTDPVADETASGVLITKYRVDAGNWQIYLGSFTITVEGRHTLEYYSLDRVQNTEQLKTASLAVDNTPPVSAISLGEPKYEVFGLPVLLPDTLITLSAFDPVSGDVSSGLNSIYYEIEDAHTGVRAPAAAYLEPFRLAQGAFIIRYWSRDNVKNTEAPKETRVSVMTWKEDGLAAVSGLDMSGTADITGIVKSNAVVSVSGNARILGPVTASTITVSGKAQITGQKTVGATPVHPEPVYMPDIARRIALDNNNDLIDPQYMTDGKLVLASKSGLVLSTGTYYFKGLETAGGSSITIAGEVGILVEGGVKISGGSSINANGSASSLKIFVSTASTVDFTGGADFLACLYAPYSHMKLAGNAVLGGHYFVKTSAVSGTGNFVQSGETLPQAVIITADSGGGKKKAAALGAGSAVATILAGPDPAFRLNDVYVFPNPAKSGARPVFHIEVGIADNVKVTVYTVSGRIAHERLLTGPPIVLDDGNGLDYVYEYAWDGHIPSGVYYYNIEAGKAGQKIRKTGKLIVVR